jgi:hypothetical protein
MPQQPNLPSATLGDFVATLQTRIQTVENEIATLFPDNGDSFVMPGDANLGTLTLNDTMSVANPSTGKVTFYSTGTDLKSRNPSGTVQTFLTTGGSSSVVQSDGNPSVAGNIPKYSDTSGQLVTDSGLSASTLKLDDLKSMGVLDQVYSVAPAGQRDLWQYSTGAAGGRLVYLPGLDIIIDSETNTNSLNYSTNGGVSFTPCTFDIAPTGDLHVGFNGTKVVALGITVPETYTSTDGIHFTKGTNAPAACFSFNIEWFSGASLFVAGVNASPTQQIMTSPNGTTWTLRTSSIEADTLKSNESVIVAVGAATPFYQYSTDGITWINTASTVASTRALAWSAERKEFLAIVYATGEGFTSSNGVTWTSVGVIAPVNVNDALIWVANNGYNRYYLSKIDIDGNYSLWSTLDSSVAFVGTHLDGAVNNPLSYSLVYASGSDHFVIGVNNAPSAAYGIPRTLDLKVLSDNIRVRGAPVTVGLYSSAADSVISGTTSETVFPTPSSLVGSLIIQDSQPIGMVIALEMNIVTSTVAGDTVIIRIKANGTNAFVSSAITLPTGAGFLNIRALMTVRSANLQINVAETVSGVVTRYETALPAFTRTVINTLSVSGTLGVSTSSLTMNQMVISSHFRNGA